MAVILIVVPHLRLAPAVRRDRRRGRLLLAGSLVVWLGSLSLVWWFSDQPIPFVCSLAALGGGISGILGTLRSTEELVQKTEGWIFFRVLSTLAGSVVWILVLQQVWRSREIDERWMTFFIGVLAYTVVRDLLQTTLMAMRSKAHAQEAEALRRSQTERVALLTSGLTTQAPAAAVGHYASRVQLSSTSADER